MIYVLDTHPIIWFVENDPRLSAAAKAVLQPAQAQLVIPTMALIEIRHLHAKGRISIGLAAVYQYVIKAKNCKVHAIDEDLLPLIPTGLNIHDSIIVATVLFYRDIKQQLTTLITKDGAVTRAGLIQTLW